MRFRVFGFVIMMHAMIIVSCIVSLIGVISVRIIVIVVILIVITVRVFIVNVL